MHIFEKMQNLYYSFIIPVYNRPKEIEELLESLTKLEGDIKYEVVIVEDGSTVTCESVCSRFRESVNIKYYFKQNSGPGDSRNYGMQKASGNYFIIYDSDCIIPQQYLVEVDRELQTEYVDCYGGPDAADGQFSNIQKAINYSMTSFFTTGGIRGGSEALGKFQPRSFNMGLSKKAFDQTKGFGKIHPGEDPDLTIRLWKAGYRTRLFREAYVYHKRRINFQLFIKQVRKFGKVRVILNKWHPETAKMIYWFPTVFILGFILSILLSIISFPYILYFYLLYVLIVFLDSTLKNGIIIGSMSILAIFIQFYGYGTGFLNSFIQLKILGKEERKVFPNLFFK